jgi:hypothetical protein
MSPPRRALLAILTLLAAACASTPPPPPPPPAWSDATRAEAERLVEALRATAPAGDALVVRLAFGADADLDLYVTDPSLETVYYANTPAVSGGALLADRRCDGPPGDGAAAEAGVRIETVRFERPPPGRYRIGIDFPHRCDGGPDEVPFAVSVDHPALHEGKRGMARWLDFTVIFHEFSIGE